MRGPLSEKALVKGTLLHVNAPSQTPSVVVASLAGVNHHQKFIQGDARSCWSGGGLRNSLGGSVPLHR